MISLIRCSSVFCLFRNASRSSFRSWRWLWYGHRCSFWWFSGSELHEISSSDDQLSIGTFRWVGSKWDARGVSCLVQYSIPIWCVCLINDCLFRSFLWWSIARSGRQLVLINFNLAFLTLQIQMFSFTHCSRRVSIQFRFSLHLPREFRKLRTARYLHRFALVEK